MIRSLSLHGSGSVGNFSHRKVITKVAMRGITNRAYVAIYVVCLVFL